MMLRITLIFVILCAVEPAKILGIFPIPQNDHFYMYHRLIKELTRRGHDITVLSPYTQYNEIENCTGIVVQSMDPVMTRFNNIFHERRNTNFITSTCFLYDMAYELTKAFLTDKKVQIHLKSNRRYDLVLTEYFMNEATLGIGKLLRAPTVLISTLPSSTLNNHLFSNPLPSSFVPNFLTEFTGTMSYWERFSNLLFNIMNNNYRSFVMMPKQNELLKKNVDENFEIEEVTKDVDLILLNSHPSVTEPVPLSPNMIEIGGLHIDSSFDSLGELKNFMDSSKNGVILFSIDSNLRSADLGNETIKVLSKAFSRIELDVLWKFIDPLPNLSANVRRLSWFQKQVILNHPKTRAFISDGELLSSIETVYYGVPMLGIPMYRDQESNVARAVQNGYAISIPFKDITEDELVYALNKILEDPKYMENAWKRSKLFRDQPVQPLDEAVYWIEFVLKHNGSKFLQSPGVQLHWYQKHSIDIIVVLVILDIVLFLIFYYIFKHIIHSIRVAIQRTHHYGKLEKI